MTKNFHQFTDEELRYFIFALVRWLKIEANLAKCPPLVVADVNTAEALMLTYDTALDKVGLHATTSEADIIDKDDARAAIITWIGDNFVPFIFENKRVSNKDRLVMGYHRPQDATIPTEAHLNAPFLAAKAEGHFAVRVYPHKSRGNRGKPDNALVCLIQERITLPDGIVRHKPVLDAAHEADQELATDLHNGIQQKGHKLPVSQDHGWETIAIVTSVESGILFHYDEDDIDTERHYRIIWGNNKGYSLWSNTSNSIIF